jgi:4-alpha-glucanotransferase
MAVLQFAFGDKADNAYLPHNIEANCVVYPGTHDNDTTLGWYASAGEKVQDHFRRYLRCDGRDAGWDLIRSGYSSTARLAVFTLQDILGLGSEARNNTPGRPDGNWQWRCREDQLERLSDGTAAYLRSLGELYGRV